MSCNGCRVLRKGCSDDCMLRHCLLWIENPQAQGHATLFVAKFFGRAALMSFISSVSTSQRSALFQSLLYEAVGRSINPVNGVVGLLWSGNWHLCQMGVEKVLQGVSPLTLLTHLPNNHLLMMGTSTADHHHHHHVINKNNNSGSRRIILNRKVDDEKVMLVQQASQEESDETTTFGSSSSQDYCPNANSDDDETQRRKLLTLFF